MSEETSIQFEQFTDTTILVTANGGYIGEIAVDEDGEAQIDFNTCWLTRTDLEYIVNKMRELEVQALTLARVRKLIEAECQDRGWLMQDIDWWEVEEKK